MMTLKIQSAAMMARRHARRQGFWTALLCAALMPIPANATWEIIPRVDTNLRYETNPRMARDLPDGSSNPIEDEATSMVVFFELPITYRTERTSAVFTPKYLRSFYAESDDSDLEDENLYLPLRYTYSWLRAKAGFFARYSDLSIRTSEFDSVDPDDPVGDGSGDQRVVDDSQIRWQFNPYWNYQFTQRNSLSLDGSYSDVSYDRDQLFTTRTDYESGSVSAGWTHSFNERNALSVIVSAGRYESEAPRLQTSNDTDSYSLKLAYQRTMSERTSITVTGGMSNTDWKFTRTQETVNGLPVVDISGDPVCGFGSLELDPGNFIRQPCIEEGDDTNFVGGIDVTRRSETSRLTLSVDQQIRPSSGGVTTLSTIGRVWWTKEFSERFSTKLGSVLVRNEDVGGNSPRERTYVNGEATFRYKLTRQFALRGGYRIRWEDVTDIFGVDEGDAYNHLFFVGLSWTGVGWSW